MASMAENDTLFIIKTNVYVKQYPEGPHIKEYSHVREYPLGIWHLQNLLRNGLKFNWKGDKSTKVKPNNWDFYDFRYLYQDLPLWRDKKHGV